jgi:hypothetical protein
MRKAHDRLARFRFERRDRRVRIMAQLPRNYCIAKIPQGGLSARNTLEILALYRSATMLNLTSNLS